MKFSIRDLLLLTVIVALVLGWAVDHYHSTRIAERANKAEQISAALERVLRDQGWHVEFSNGHVYATKELHPSDPVTVYALPISEAPAPNPPKK